MDYSHFVLSKNKNNKMENDKSLVAINDQIHVDLMELLLNVRYCQVNSIYSHLVNPGGKGKVALCTGDGYDLTAPYDAKIQGLGEIIADNSPGLLKSFHGIPGEFIFRWINGEDFDPFLDAIIPKMLRLGYHFKQTDTVSEQAVEMSIFSDRGKNKVDIFRPDCITNIDQVVEYCTKHSIEILSMEKRGLFRWGERYELSN